MTLKDTIKRYIRIYQTVRNELPEYKEQYSFVNNQGNLSDYLITVHQVKPGVWTDGAGLIRP